MQPCDKIKICNQVSLESSHKCSMSHCQPLQLKGTAVVAKQQSGTGEWNSPVKSRDTAWDWRVEQGTARLNPGIQRGTGRWSSPVKSQVPAWMCAQGKGEAAMGQVGLGTSASGATGTGFLS